MPKHWPPQMLSHRLLLLLVIAAAALLSTARNADSTPVAHCEEEDAAGGGGGGSGGRGRNLPTERLREQPQQRQQAARRFADAVRRCYDVPGLAVGFSLGGERHAFGLGVADVESGESVTAHTLFGVGSLTKAFSSALLAEILPKSGFHWNSLLKDLIPGFRMNTTFLTQHVTLADVLTHRTGVTDFVAALIAGYPLNVDRRELERRIQFHAPTLGFRTSVSYNNHLYALGGAVVEHLTGLSWEQLINATLFTPLNMTSSSFAQSWKDLPNLSKMYCTSVRDGNAELPFEPLEFVNPLASAGSILSSADDMLKWLDFNLEKATLKDGVWSQVFTSHAPVNGRPYESGFGFGWIKGHYGDVPFWQHEGSIDGYCSIATLLYEHNATIFLTANQWCGHGTDGSGGFGSALQPLARLLVETILGLPVANDAQSICALRKTSVDAATFPTAVLPPAERSEVAASQDSAQCFVAGENLTIEFSNPAFGDVVLTHNGSSLRWQFGQSRGSLLPAPQTLPAHRFYAMHFEGWREQFNRLNDAASEGQLRLTLAADCGSLWLLDEPVVMFSRQNRSMSNSERSSGALSYRLPGCGVTILSSLLLLAKLYCVNCLLCEE